ncbi:uroporphyrin-3 C-methyltransferase [Pasteurella langaaensis DSM 22999]|uniref:Uroporphyrin-3 C-methyltransferase n=1 Tax=Alitibacter langaaensis DSM 22999 TaxID=1122935 RepID=A0A2U0SM42_9PAST|nr:uroporphyrinogen-III C-methyltransferase [Pasteurella langaaensis]PVX32409.1 uroporphyrin-3 C-methyltransferase [Pasteurella langaaensis DSM 22999]
MSNKKDLQTDAVETEISAETTDNGAKQNADSQKTDKQAEIAQEKSVDKTETVVVKKGGSGLAFLSLLVALGVGGAGYYFGQQEVERINQKFTALESHMGHTISEKSEMASQNSAEMPNVEKELSQLSDMAANLKSTEDKVSALEISLSDKEKALAALRDDVAKLGNNATAQPNDWLLSEADFLLTNALRKLVLDNDVDTSISLLKISDEVLAKVSDPAAKTVRVAINNDLKQLLSLNRVDQNTLMQTLSQLANSVDELVVMNVNFGDEPAANNDKVSDDVMDWKANLEKTARSFMNHFIRITPRTDSASQALLAPNQDIYLRENIRLRLQIAILAVPRQQNELYKQSLETVAAWIRSYFDTNTEVAANFLKSLDELADQSIYVDVPNQLSSLIALDKVLNKQPQEVQKVEISADKALTEANQAAAQEIKAEDKAAENKSDDKAAEKKSDDAEPAATAPADESQKAEQQ